MKQIFHLKFNFLGISTNIITAKRITSVFLTITFEQVHIVNVKRTEEFKSEMFNNLNNPVKKTEL